MADIPLRLLAHVRATAALLRLPAALIPTVVGVVALIVALLTKPGSAPGFWNWTGLLAILVLAALSVLVDLSRKPPRVSAATRTETGVAAVVLLIVAFALNLLASFAGAVALLLGVVAIAAVGHRAWRVRPVSPVLCGVVAIAVPVWAWLSLGAGSWGLWLLPPLALLAWLADRYMASALGADSAESGTLARSWRFLAWLTLLAGSLATSVLAVSSDISNAWAVVGALGALACIGADVGVPHHAGQPGAWSRPLMATGFAWLSLCWLAGL